MDETQDPTNLSFVNGAVYSPNVKPNPHCRAHHRGQNCLTPGCDVGREVYDRMGKHREHQYLDDREETQGLVNTSLINRTSNQ